MSNIAKSFPSPSDTPETIAPYPHTLAQEHHLSPDQFVLVRASNVFSGTPFTPLDKADLIAAACFSLKTAACGTDRDDRINLITNLADWILDLTHK